MSSRMMHQFPYAGRVLESSAKGSLWDLGLIYSPNFVLILNSHVYSVQSISGFDENHAYDPITEGGNFNQVFVRKYFGTPFQNITLSRAMPIRSTQLITSLVRSAMAAAVAFVGGVAQDLARKAALLTAAELDPIATLEQGPAIGIIQIFDRNYEKDVANFKFFSYGAERIDMGGVDADSSKIVLEEVTLVCSDFQRMTTTWAEHTIGRGIFSSGYDESLYEVGDFSTHEEDSSKKDENEEKDSEKSDDDSEKSDDDSEKSDDNSEKSGDDSEKGGDNKGKQEQEAEKEMDEIEKILDKEKEEVQKQLDEYLAKIDELRKKIEEAKSKQTNSNSSQNDQSNQPNENQDTNNDQPVNDTNNSQNNQSNQSNQPNGNQGTNNNQPINDPNSSQNNSSNNQK